MAALHWEAQRKQGVIDKRSKVEEEQKAKLKLLQEQNQKELQESRSRQGSSYEKQLQQLLRQGSQSGRCPRGEYHQNRDAERRREFYEANKGSHSAKIQLRYNDINFAQQW